MACNNCKNSDDLSCTDIVPSNCVSWQGNKVDELEICINDSLTYVQEAVIAKILDLLKGKGIVLDTLTLSDCEYVDDMLGSEEKNLLNVLRVYKEAICDLKLSVKSNGDNIFAFTNIAAYTLGCIGAQTTFKGLIQAIITKVCDLNTQLSGVAQGLLDAIEDATGNMLVSGAVKSAGGNGVKYVGTGSAAQVVFEALVPPNCPILYTGSTSVFAADGTGLANTQFAGWFLCNGANGTPDSSTLPQNGAGTLKYIIRFN